jgi:integrase/recombinase XerD
VPLSKSIHEDFDMHILKVRANSGLRFQLIDDAGESMPIIDLFAAGLEARGCSPNTIVSYLYDLRRFYEFLKEANLTVDDFRPKHSIDFLTFLNAIKPKRRKVELSPVQNGVQNFPGSWGKER